MPHQLCMAGCHEEEKKGEKKKKEKAWEVCPRAAENSSGRPSLLLSSLGKLLDV